jgi:PAS domain S-box-containing protein
MSIKPSYEELEQRVKELEKESALRKEAEESLRESEERYRMVVEHSSDGVAIVMGDSHIYLNRQFARIFGYDRPEEIVGKPISLFVHPDDRERVTRSNYWRQQGGSAPSRYECKGICRDGGEVYLSVSASSTTYRGEPVSLVFLRDITERKVAEDRIHWLTHEMIRVQENERQRISRELHDRVAQDLSMTKIITDRLLQSRKEAELPDVEREIAKISGTLQAAIHTVRNLAYDLRPPMIDDMGLVQAIFHYCEDFSERTALAVDFSSAGLDNIALDSDTEIHLYRLIQEGLNNIHKHAEARRATLRLVKAYPHIILRIKDDGKGFDVNARRAVSTQEKRMGLQSMEERVHLLGGEIDIQSSPMRGTKIAIKIPSKEEARDVQENPLDR